MCPGVWPGVATATIRPSSVSGRLAANAPEGPAVEPERLVLHAGRQGLPEHALEETRSKAVRERELGLVHHHLLAHVNRSVHVIAMEMGEHNGLDVRERQAHLFERARKLVLT